MVNCGPLNFLNFHELVLQLSFIRIQQMNKWIQNFLSLTWKSFS